MKFLFAMTLFLGSFSWAQEGLGSASAPSMRIGEQSGTYGQILVPGIKCDACEKFAISQNLDMKGLNTNPGRNANGTGEGSANGAAEK